MSSFMSLGSAILRGECMLLSAVALPYCPLQVPNALLAAPSLRLVTGALSMVIGCEGPKAHGVHFPSL